MATILKVEKIASGVVLNDGQTSYNCRPVNLSGMAVGETPVYYAVGSNPAASGTFSGALYGALTEADLANSSRRLAIAELLFSETDATAIARKLKNQFSISMAPTDVPWQQLVLSRASGAGTAITVDVWVYWREHIS